MVKKRVKKIKRSIVVHLRLSPREYAEILDFIEGHDWTVQSAIRAFISAQFQDFHRDWIRRYTASYARAVRAYQNKSPEEFDQLLRSTNNLERISGRAPDDPSPEQKAIDENKARIKEEKERQYPPIVRPAPPPPMIPFKDYVAKKTAGTYKRPEPVSTSLPTSSLDAFGCDNDDVEDESF